ncbi:hypothetical protein ACWGH3_15420 [Streptomyces sp. NPDC054884]|uniref:hypothetical protein n=1 Tax=Streptomyces sp. ME08-AFT2 TaxID=3028683 RepID=UPI0029A95E08|nr:hypothetical protein [Streptomyces sp. ME08-AFT2]MDX3314088.1 hypothetical protein [Streptomyces sp. ME08-AFT2]
MKRGTRITTIVGTAAVITLAMAPIAEANWSSSITGASASFESRRWSDELYSQVKFTGCTTDGSKSTDVQIWNDITLQPDEAYDNKTFTACFNGGTSNGEWTDLPSGMRDYYFKLMKIGGSTFGPQLSVRTVSVDTTKAD